MLSRRVLQSTVRARIGSYAAHPAAPVSIFSRGAANGDVPPPPEQLTPWRRNDAVPRVVDGDVRQLAFNATFRDLTEAADGLRGEFSRLRGEIAAVGRACADAKVQGELAPLAQTSELRTELRELRQQIAVVDKAYNEVAEMRKDLKSLKEEIAPTPPPVTLAAEHNDVEWSRWARFKASFEVSVSKLFPGGFGWQLGGNIAEGVGYGATSLGFAVSTGIGDALGVGFGHCCYFALKKCIYPEINLAEQVSAGTMLGSAAFISGTIWQPMVNISGLLGLNFIGHFALVGTVCGIGFYGGLRLFRALYCRIMPIEPPNYKNLMADAQLSVSIAGATGTFTATDPGLTGNFYANYIGVQGADAPLTGCVKAGSSTLIGFLKVQSLQNIIYRPNRNWIDGGKMQLPISAMHKH